MAYTTISLGFSVVLGSLYWLAITAIVSRQVSAQRMLSLVMPWLVAVAILVLYLTWFYQHGFSVIAVVAFIVVFGVFVGTGWTRRYALSSRLSRLRPSALWFGVFSTLATVWVAWSVLGHAYSVSFDFDNSLVLGWLTALLFLGFDKSHSRQAR